MSQIYLSALWEISPFYISKSLSLSSFSVSFSLSLPFSFSLSHTYTCACVYALAYSGTQAHTQAYTHTHTHHMQRNTLSGNQSVTQCFLGGRNHVENKGERIKLLQSSYSPQSRFDWAREQQKAPLKWTLQELTWNT